MRLVVVAMLVAACAAMPQSKVPQSIYTLGTISGLPGYSDPVEDAALAAAFQAGKVPNQYLPSQNRHPTIVSGHPAADAGLQAAGSKFGVAGSWNPKTLGVRVWQSPNKQAQLGLGVSSDFNKDHGVGLGFKWTF